MARGVIHPQGVTLRSVVPYVGAPEIKARRLVLAIRYHSHIGNPGQDAEHRNAATPPRRGYERLNAHTSAASALGYGRWALTALVPGRTPISEPAHPEQSTRVQLSTGYALGCVFLYTDISWAAVTWV